MLIGRVRWSVAFETVVFMPMAISLIVPLAVFFAFQRYFVQGLLAGSVK